MAKKLTRQDIINWATARGWKLDKYGHLRKVVGDREYRLKLSGIAVRNEVKVHYDDGTSGWVRLSSAYFRDLFISEDDKLTGMKK